MADYQSIIASIRLGLDEMDKDCDAAKARLEKLAGQLENQGKQAGKQYVQGFGKAQVDMNKKLNDMVSSLQGVSPKMGAMGEKMAGVFSKPIFSMIPAVTMAFQAMLPVIGTILVAVGSLIKGIQAGAKAQKEFSDNVNLAGNAADILSGKTKTLSDNQKKSNELSERGAVATAKIQQALKNMGDAISGFLAPAVNFLNSLWVGFLENLGKIAVGIGTVMAAIGVVVPGIGAAGAALIAFGASVEGVSEAEATAARNAQALKEQNAGLVSSYEELQSALKNTETAERAGAVTSAEAAEGRLNANQAYLDSLINLRNETEAAAEENGLNAAAEIAAYDKKIAAQVVERNNLRAIVDANKAAADAQRKAAAEAAKQGDIISAYRKLQTEISQKVLANNNALQTELKLARDRNATEYELKKIEDDHAKAYRDIHTQAAKALLDATGLYNETRATAPITFGLIDSWTAIGAGVAEAVARSKEFQALMDEQADALAEQAIAQAQENGNIQEAVDLQMQLIDTQRQRARIQMEASEEFKAASKTDQAELLADFARVTEGMKTQAKAAINEVAKERGDLLADQGDALAQIAIEEAKQSGNKEEALRLELELYDAQRKRERDALEASAVYITAGDKEREAILKNFDDITAGQKRIQEMAAKTSPFDSEAFKTTVQLTGAATDTIGTVGDAMIGQLQKESQAMIDAIDQALAYQKEQIEAARQAALEAAGFAEAQTAEDMQAQIDAAKEAGDEVLQYELERRQQEMAINEEYDARAKAAEEKAAHEKADIQYKAAMAAYKMDIIKAANAMAMSVMQALSAAPPPINFVLAGLSSAAGAVQIGLLAANPPKKPAFADGGIVPGNPRAGDVQQILATGGEGVFTADQMEAMGMMANNGGGQTVVLNATFMLDTETIGKATFNWANANGAVLQARAVIGL